MKVGGIHGPFVGLAMNIGNRHLDSDRSDLIAKRSQAILAALPCARKLDWPSGGRMLNHRNHSSKRAASRAGRWLQASMWAQP